MTDAGSDRLPREVWILSAVAFAVAVGFGIVAPAIPLFARTFGVGVAAGGLVISAFAFMRFVSALGAGRLVDRLGERSVMATGIAVVAVSSALAGLSRSYWQLLTLRGAGGVGSAMFSVSAASLLLRVAGPAQRGRATGVWTGGFLLGGICGPAFGSVIIERSLRAPFFLYAATLAVAGTIGLVALRHTPLASREGAGGRPPMTLREAFRLRAYIAAMVTNLADTWAILGVRSAIIPLFVTAGLGLPVRWVGIGFVVVAGINGAVLWPAGRLSDRHGRRPLMIGGCLVSATGMAVLATVPGLPGYLSAMALLGLGSGLLDVGPAAMMGDVLAGRGGRVVAAYQMAGDAGAMAGPVVAGTITDAVGYGAAFGVSSLVLLTAAGFAVTAPETRRATHVAASAATATTT